jgi:hypothetical protein
MSYNDWYAKNPNSGAGFLEEARWDAHVWGRQAFAKSYARGGIAATVFAPSRKEMILSPWRKKFTEGSPEYVQRLRKLEAVTTDPRAKQGIQKAIGQASSGKRSLVRGGLSGVAGAGLMAAMVLYPALTEEGPANEKARAVTKGVGAMAGWAVGSKAGMGIGAAIGSYVPVVGTAIGAVVGYVAGGLIGSGAGEAVTDAITRVPDRMVDRERSRRKLEWGNNIAAFTTQRASTMRQQSLSLMNRGQMSARSLMGQEATFIHK